MDVPPGRGAALRHLLDPAEQARADRFRFAEDRDSYVAAHALLRVMLSRLAPVDPAAWRFSVAPGGKPSIHPSFGRPDLRFSLSHTRGMVACAVGRGHDLGVDVERCDQSRPIAAIAQRFFAPAEADLIASAPPARRSEMFHRIWTLKEAYTKVTGLGIAAPLGAFAFRLEPPPISIAFLQPGAGDPAAWQFRDCEPAPQYRLAVAIRRPASEPDYLFDMSALAPERLRQTDRCGNMPNLIG